MRDAKYVLVQRCPLRKPEGGRERLTDGIGLKLIHFRGVLGVR